MPAGIVGRLKGRVVVFLLLLLLVFTCVVNAQAPSVTGSVHIHNPVGPFPYPAVGYEVFLWNGQQWSYPSITDSYGRFAFYNVPPRFGYLMRIYRLRIQVWEQEISSPVTLAPIVISP